jgi:hypothetical protein
MSAMDESSNVAEEDSIWSSAESAKQIQKLGQVEQVLQPGVYGHK